MQKNLKQLQDKINLDVPAQELERAFLHTSFVNETGEELKSYERLEFLGDAVVELAIREHLFNSFPDEDEGELSKIKAVAVSKPVLSDKAAELELGKYVFLGKGEKESGGRNKDSILCDVYESLVGILFINKGYSEAAKFVVESLEDEVNNLIDQQRVLSYKSALQIEAQKRYEKRPDYRILEETGQAHKRKFKVEASLNHYSGIGRGRSKKEAEEAAAKQVYLQMQRE